MAQQEEAAINNQPAAPRRRTGIIRRLVGSLGLLLNLGVMLWAALCFAAGYVSGARYPLLQLFSLTTPFAMAANLGFLVFWLFARRKWRMVMPAFTLAVCNKLLLASFGWHFFTAQDLRPGPDRLKVMTWNTHGMGIFEKNQKNSIDREAMDLIRAESPDILVMPEFYTMYNNALKPYATSILAEGGYREYRFQYDNTLGTRVFLGTGIFSRFPIVRHQTIKLDRYVYLLESDVEIRPGKIMRLYSTHLQSFRLPDQDKALLEDAKRSVDLGKARGRGFLSKFTQAYELRAHQADTVATIVANSPYPAMICGDFNDLPGSYVYNRVKGPLLRDAHARHGRGFGRSYNMFSPTLRIDYILYSPKLLEIVGVKTRKTRLSDHNPVIATFRVK